MSYSNKRFDLNGTTYNVQFISSGMGRVSYAVMKCGGAYKGEARVECCEDNKTIRCPFAGEHGMTEEEVITALAEIPEA